MYVYIEYVFIRVLILWFGDKRLMYNYYFFLKNKCFFEVI